MVGDRPARDRGAAAVEFALVMPILAALFLGIVDYGVWFSDSLSVRQGVREGARQAAVQQFDSCAGNSAQKTACMTKSRVSAIGGTTYVKVLPLTTAGAPGGSWIKGNSVLVCVITKETGLTGFTPMPHKGLLSNKVSFRIEQSEPGTPGSSTFQDSPPTGANWAWCT
jgi:hypothetical protein